MTIRSAVPQDFPALRRMDAIAFGKAYDGEKECTLPSAEDAAKTIAAFDGEGKALSGLTAWPFAMVFDGHVVGLLGVGGVMSLPEARGKGNVRDLFGHMFREGRNLMRSKLNEPPLFSALFAFSNRYYRQFGYEALRTPKAIVKLDAFERFPRPARVDMLEDGATLTDFMAVQEPFARGCNMGVVRGEGEWKSVLGGGLKNCVYAYLVRDEGGKPCAHMVLTRTTREDRPCLNLTDLSYNSPEALRQAMGFLFGLRAVYRDVLLDLPFGEAPFHWFAEPYEASFSYRPNGMARVADARRVLSLMRHPKEGGAYALAVEDDFLPENSGVYRVEFAGGTAEARRVVGVSPDMRVSVQALAVLALGNASFDEARVRGDVEVYANDETLRKVFVHKRIFLPDKY